MATIGDRVRTAMSSAGMQQKQLAERVGMTPDSLSRALNDQRGFAAVELAAIATELRADVHELITGTPDPHRLVLSARHTFDHETGSRTVDGLGGDSALLDDVRLAFAQAGTARPGVELPSDVEQMRGLFPEGFVWRFIDHLAEIEVDVVRLDGLSAAYSLTVEGRPVIVLPESGNWFRENWSLAHELGHLALGHEGVIEGSSGFEAKESAANSFAAKLLLPETQLRQTAWNQIRLPALAELVWDWGISTDALRRRLNAHALEPSDEVGTALSWTTQKLLRRHWKGANVGDPISRRMTEAGERRFPAWLQEAHLERIAEGAVGKGTLAWMLGVPADSLEVDEPKAAQELTDDALAALLG
ncbi:ImmA/IrrE family metallo-endopeptidase [Brachybacterium sp. FME24]|uniref:helix-turn-helix domain-containing protein n=1 Tax=Brachybacterium sp. FME24 TaxID=2742605 RepID=UPI001868D62A|nr:XRE family transcriptional regulator [Brachybacterium sp. FME24]